MLRARLLGPLEVQLDGRVIDSPASQRPWVLFAYLALSPRPASRAELISCFWPDVLDTSARASLRSALWALRRHVGDWLAVDGERVGLLESDELWIDTREFERLAAEQPQQALELCRGPLLQGLEDEWALSARERHREQTIELLERLALAAQRSGESREALELTRRQCECDPLDEDAHRRLMARLIAAGDRGGAMRAFRALSERLRRELGVAPSAQTRELIESARAEAPAPAAVRAAPTAGLLRLVGRERELAELEAVWRAVAQGAGASAVIRGEAGIGKTRLASELRARALESGGVAVVGAALDLGGSAPLSLWAELVRELLPALAAPPPEASWPEDLALLTSELPAHFARAPGAGAAVAPDLQRTRLFEAVVALLCWAARERPLLLVLEDVHSADAPSLELAAYAARRLADLRVMLLATRRELPPSVDADRFEYALRSRGLLACELDLGPLAPEPLASLARTAARLSDIDVERVVASAEGNALLAVETARALGRGYSEVAPSLRGAARAALAPLAGDVRGLVEIAAVAARSLEPHEIAQLSLEDAEDAASQALLSGVLLSEEGRIGFRHALLREAVFEEIAEPRRRSLHKRWARALLASERAGAIARPAEVARQLRLAGSDADAAPQLARAAAEARALAALDAAVAYLEEALEIDAEKAELWLELGEVEAWRAERERAETAFERAAGLLSGAPPLARARAELRRARAYHGPICDPRGVLESTSAALELLEGSEVAAPDERSEALAARAWAEAVAGSVEEAERLLAELAADSLEHDDLRTYDLGHARALALMRRGRFVESYEPSIEAGEAIARAGRPDMAYGCWANAAGAATAAGDHARALEFLDRSTEAIAGQGLQGVEIHLIAARSFIMRRLGLLAEARAAAEAEQALAEQLGQADLLAMAMHDRGLVALAQEEFELAVALLGEALAADAPISRPLTRLALAEALARSKQPERAEEEVRSTVLEPVRASDFPEALVPRLARVQGLAALARGERAEAERRFAEAIAGWERLVARGHAGESITAVLADLGRPVVGVVEPEHELATVRAELDSIPTSTGKGRPNALVP